MLHELLAGQHPTGATTRPSTGGGSWPGGEAAGPGRHDAGTGQQRRGQRRAAPLPVAGCGGPADAAELRAVLSGRGPRPEAARAAAAGTAAPAAAGGTRATSGTSGTSGTPATAPRAAAPGTPAAAAARGGEPIASNSLELLGPTGGRCRSACGRCWARPWCASSDRTASTGTTGSACSSAPPPGSGWSLPSTETTNETLVNGQALTAPRALRHGDVIAVGRQAKNVAKMPLTARGR
jgi:hypothetical protein